MFTRTVKTPDTFGLSSKIARKVRDRAEGRVAAAQGRHAGGPCPAVCLATLTGWTYTQAEDWLRKYGFAGAGMTVPMLLRAYSDALGEAEHLPPVGSVRVTVSRLPAGFEGAVICRHHVMPVRNGRVLNATEEHLRAKCTHVLRYNIVEAAT